MFATLASRGAVSQPVQDGSMPLRIRPRWPSGVSLFWLGVWLIIVATPPPTKADEPATDGWKFSITPYG